MNVIHVKVPSQVQAAIAADYLRWADPRWAVEQITLKV